MNNNEDALVCYDLDFNGLAVVAKLVELRVLNDIAETERRLDQEKEALRQRKVNSNFWDAPLNLLGENRVAGWTADMEGKKKWLSQWQDIVWTGLEQANAEVTTLRQTTVEEILQSSFLEDKLLFQRYLLLQEAILAPVYRGPGNLHTNLTEIDVKSQCVYVAAKAGFPSFIGTEIYDRTELFLKDAARHDQKLTSGAIIGSAVMAVVVIMAAAPIAGMVGAAAGLHGAAAVSAGLAALGGGSIATGGFGMAGGFGLLFAGGTAMGGIGGLNIAKQFCELKREVAVLSVAKRLNYLSYLASYRDDHSELAVQLMQQVIEEFIVTKHRLERDYIVAAYDAESKNAMLDGVHLFNLAFDKLAETMATCNRRKSSGDD